MSKKTMNKNNTIFIFLFLIIGIGLLSLSLSTIVTNAQAYSGSISGGSSSDSGSSGTGGSEGEDNNGKDQKQKDNTDKQTGICVVGVESPCNGDSNRVQAQITNSQPVIIPNRQNPSTTTILTSNAVASSAVVIDSAGNVKHLDNNAAYSVKGDEKLVNSGMLFPKGMGPPNGNTTFTLTFEKAGTYDYYCILHPWQKGKVAVQQNIAPIINSASLDINEYNTMTITQTLPQLSLKHQLPYEINKQ